MGIFSYGILEQHPKIRFVLGRIRHRLDPVRRPGDGLPLEQRAGETKSRANRPLKGCRVRSSSARYGPPTSRTGSGWSLRDFFGEGHMMWASDYPHPDSTWRTAQRSSKGRRPCSSPTSSGQILRENAKSLRPNERQRQTEQGQTDKSLPPPLPAVGGTMHSDIRGAENYWGEYAADEWSDAVVRP